MARELFRTPIWRLDKFIEDQLLPDTTFLTELRADIDSISAFLKERCFQGATHPMRVARVVMVSPISLSSSGWGGRGLSEARLQSLVGCELPTCSVPSVLMCIPAMAQGLSPVPQGDPEPSIILQRCQFHSSGLNRIPLHMGELSVVDSYSIQHLDCPAWLSYSLLFSSLSFRAAPMMNTLHSRASQRPKWCCSLTISPALRSS